MAGDSQIDRRFRDTAVWAGRWIQDDGFRRGGWWSSVASPQRAASTARNPSRCAVGQATVSLKAGMHEGADLSLVMGVARLPRSS